MITVIWIVVVAVNVKRGERMTQIEIIENWMNIEDNKNKLSKVFELIRFDIDNYNFLSYVINCLDKNMTPTNIKDELIQIDKDFNSQIIKLMKEL